MNREAVGFVRASACPWVPEANREHSSQTPPGNPWGRAAAREGWRTAHQMAPVLHEAFKETACRCGENRTQQRSLVTPPPHSLAPRPGHSPGLLSVGGDRRSRIWASFSPSTHWTSRVRSNGQLEVQRAETAIHEQPDSTKSRSPGGKEKGSQVR